ncbi:delta-aminolevulinic acid dehydratase [candidate division MSBL1 archaeon SCGC-AAA259M10]|uniref:Delta-aminolevulinic acid dehydratase n=1 Tax=candidate division MSBL1 archaeon SCGC-AAA259M10 TaxID=1698270 RepID=A0A133UWG0_9EURY|nr:delta-aminolevulinic acid dehydratase [candidate division MSBL1 archaeon SCGC-AAA259M10]
MRFPKIRMRRLRKKKNIRKLVRSINVSKTDLLYPVFVKEGLKKKSEIKGLPNQYQYPLERLDELINKCEEAGLPAVLVFGIPESKDKIGSEAFNEEGIVQKALRYLNNNSDLGIFTDVCLCQYTSHGHCGVLDDTGLNNDKTLEILGKVAVSHANAGADFVSPSGMIDGQVKSIREKLDDAGYSGVGIMSYSAKYESNFYGPFRRAAESFPMQTGKEPTISGRSTYQMDYRARNQALREVALDVQEGADIVMVKPALPYLDVIRRVRETFDIPISAYQVSGEYSMIKKFEGESEEDILMETLFSIKRSGCDFIITYAALEVADLLMETS